MDQSKRLFPICSTHALSTQNSLVAVAEHALDVYLSRGSVNNVQLHLRGVKRYRGHGATGLSSLEEKI